MQRTTAIAAAFVGLLLLACERPTSTFPAGQWIDLTHDFSDETIYWVTAEPFRRTTVAEGMTDEGFYYCVLVNRLVSRVTISTTRASQMYAIYNWCLLTIRSTESFVLLFGGERDSALLALYFTNRRAITLRKS